MKLNKFTLGMLSIAIALTATAAATAKKEKAQVELPPYKDASLSVQERTTDLLSRMTLEEKVAQMCQYVGPGHIRDNQALAKGIAANDDAHGFYPTLSINDLYEMTEKGQIGSFLHVVTIEESNELQKAAMKSRLQIPLIIGIDAIHGNALCSGATVYPTSISQAASFNTELVEEASRQTALEVRATGSQWTFTPNIEVGRDPRWGRIGETFGEDPYLVSRMGVATVKGFQGEDCSGENSVVACIKHLVAGSEPVNGLNIAPMDISERTLREVFLPPYKAAVEEAHAYSAMAAHNELNGVPCHANRWIMNDILRDEYGFDGFIVSDWMDVSRIHTLHRYAETPKQAALKAVEAGLDMNMHGPFFGDYIVECVKDGSLQESRVDEACRKILEAKFRLGLFENPYIDPKITKKTLFNKAHQATALEAANQSIVLLKNDGLLPLDIKSYDRIMITGPNANSHAILGDWTLAQPEENVVTPLEGLQEIVGKRKVSFLDCGTDVRSSNPEIITRAEQMASECDLAIVVVGENPLRYQKEKSMGENVDRLDITLLGNQEELIKAIEKTGTPTIVVLVGGRPLAVNWASENVSALVQAWEPGSFGGRAIMNILTGEVNPSAKLPVTIPRHVGQTQLIYNHKPSQYFHNYKDGATTPLYRFGYGLSYTTFDISDVKLSRSVIAPDETIEVSAKVKNSGSRRGTEVVQLYINDLYSSATRPIKELKGFARVELEAGESRTVTFNLTPEMLAFYDFDMNFVVEPGDFEIMVGSSSDDADLKKVTLTVK